MKRIKILSNKNILCFTIALVLLSRIILLLPANFMGINLDYPMSFNGAQERNVIFLILIVLFVCSATTLVYKLYNLHGEIAALLGLMILCEPVFIIAQSNIIRLVISILLIIYVWNGISEKKLMSGGIFAGIFMFISTFLLPYSVFSYGLLMFMMLTVEYKNNKEKKANSLFVVAVCAVVGFVLNKLLCEINSTFAYLIEYYSFEDIANREKTFENIFAFAPFIISSCVFLSKYFNKMQSKANKKRTTAGGSVFFIMDLMLVLYGAAITGFIFFSDEAFFTINIITMALILTLIVNKDKVCMEIINDICIFVKKYKAETIIVFLATYYIALMFIDDYYVGSKLIGYIRY